MKAMIFAAGKGTRLKPLTDNKPKALVEVNGIPMLERVISNLISFGIKEIIINVYYLANQIIDFLESKNNFGIRIEISDETSQLLDTGGGLKKASWFFNDNEDFFIHNTDVISNIDLNKMLSFHKANNNLATLAVRDRISSRYFLFNEKNKLCGWKNVNTKEEIFTNQHQNIKKLAFSGIHILNSKIFKYFENNEPFSIIDSYLYLSKYHLIKAYEHSDDFWFDIGTTDKLNEASTYLYRLER